MFGAYSVWTIMSAKRESEAARDGSAVGVVDESAPDPAVSGPPMGWVMIGVCFAAGLVLLSLGGSLASDGASGMAIGLGVPAAVVGVTIVSIGTTLPELVTGVMAVRKGQTDLAMGNVLGSCLFNVGAIFGLTGVISAPAVGSEMRLPLVAMAVLAVALVPISRTRNHTVSRVEGGLLLGSYGLFLAGSAVLALR